MSLNNIQVIDAVGTDNSDGTVVLSIIDSWDWRDEQLHIRALQEKLNAYFGFVESGQIYEFYPDANGKDLRVDIVSKFPIPKVGLIFLEKASTTAAQLKMRLHHRVH